MFFQNQKRTLFKFWIFHILKKQKHANRQIQIPYEKNVITDSIIEWFEYRLAKCGRFFNKKFTYTERRRFYRRQSFYKIFRLCRIVNSFKFFFYTHRYYELYDIGNCYIKKKRILIKNPQKTPPSLNIIKRFFLTFSNTFLYSRSLCFPRKGFWTRPFTATKRFYSIAGLSFYKRFLKSLMRNSLYYAKFLGRIKVMLCWYTFRFKLIYKQRKNRKFWAKTAKSFDFMYGERVYR